MYVESRPWLEGGETVPGRWLYGCGLFLISNGLVLSTRLRPQGCWARRHSMLSMLGERLCDRLSRSPGHGCPLLLHSLTHLFVAVAGSLSLKLNSPQALM